MRFPVLPLALALSGVLAAPAYGGQFTDLALIDMEVARFTGAGIGQPGGASLPVDRRLHLAACRQPLALGWNGQRRDSVIVRCPDAGGWRLFVAVIGGASGTMGGPAAAVPQANAVTRGEAVTISAAGTGFSVSQPGEALEAGAVGAWIRVRPAGKPDAIRARIVRPGLVLLPIQ
jgi:flagella basal body P-ring formation protein FlgA